MCQAWQWCGSLPRMSHQPELSCVLSSLQPVKNQGLAVHPEEAGQGLVSTERWCVPLMPVLLSAEKSGCCPLLDMLQNAS